MAVDQRDPHRPGLCHPDQRVVDGAVAVRVELAHDIADDAAALDVGTVGAQAHLLHLEQDPPLHRLQPIPRIGDGPGIDDGVGIFEEAAAHLLGDVNVDDRLFEILRWGSLGSASHAAYCCASRPRCDAPTHADVR